MKLLQNECEHIIDAEFELVSDKLQMLCEKYRKEKETKGIIIDLAV